MDFTLKSMKLGKKYNKNHWDPLNCFLIQMKLHDEKMLKNI